MNSTLKSEPDVAVKLKLNSSMSFRLRLAFCTTKLARGKFNSVAEFVPATKIPFKLAESPPLSMSVEVTPT